jgi:hypothetical protein
MSEEQVAPAGSGGPVTREEQLAWERTWGPRAAISAALALFAFFAGGALVASARGGADDTAELLREFADNETTLIAASLVSLVGLIAQLGALYYLWRATKFRRPESPNVAWGLAVAGALLSAVLGIVVQIESVSVGQDFVAGRPLNDDRADDLVQDSLLPTLEFVRLGAGLGFGIGLLLISLNSMRAGVLSRFVGILGIIVGVLYAIPILGGPQFLLIFWLGALGLLFMNRWPGGRGPAWETGRADPWPSPAEMRARAEERRQAGDGTPPEPPYPAATDPDTLQDRPRKRKRKKR